MYNREWFRVSLVSLSLLINPLSTHAADGGITVWVIRQSVQLIATGLGLGAVAGNELLKGKGNGHVPYGISHTARVDVTAKIQSMKIDTANQGGQGTSTKKPSKSQSNEQYEEYMLREWQKQATQYDDKKLDDIIDLTQSNLDSAKADRSYYKHGTKARTELEDHINFKEKSLAQLKEIKESRKETVAQKERVSKQATTIAATAAVLTSKTAPTSAPQALEAIPGENIWKKNSKGSDKPEISEQNLQEMKESRKERKARVAKEKEERKNELNERDPGEPPHKSKEDLRFAEKDQPGQHEHQWRKEGGHFEIDTPTARELIRRAVKEGTYRGIKDGKHQYDWINPVTGEQVWVETISNKIQNHGLNVDPWKADTVTGFLQRPEDYIRANVPSVVRCDTTGAIIWPIVPALMEHLEKDNVKPSQVPDTEVRKLADAALNTYLKENPISGNVIKMPMSPINHTSAHKDYADKYQWWPYTNEHLPSDFPEAPEGWAPPSKVARYEKALEIYKNNGGFAGNYKKGYHYGNTDNIWKKGDPTPEWAKPSWDKGSK